MKNQPKSQTTKKKIHSKLQFFLPIPLANSAADETIVSSSFKHCSISFILNKFQKCSFSIKKKTYKKNFDDSLLTKFKSQLVLFSCARTFFFSISISILLCCFLCVFLLGRAIKVFYSMRERKQSNNQLCIFDLAAAIAIALCYVFIHQRVCINPSVGFVPSTVNASIKFVKCHAF